MRLFLTILEGPNPIEARPLIATEDQELISAVVRNLMARLGGKHPPGQVVELVRRGQPSDPDEQ